MSADNGKLSKLYCYTILHYINSMLKFYIISVASLLDQTKFFSLKDRENNGKYLTKYVCFYNFSFNCSLTIVLFKFSKKINVDFYISKIF